MGPRVGARRAAANGSGSQRRDVPWEEAAIDFLRDKKGEGRSGATLELYESYLSDRRLRTWRQDHGIETIADVS
jgi:hypothetical protein